MTGEEPGPPTSGQWAPDPYGRAQLRYYDGHHWTAHVSTNGVVSSDPPTWTSAPVAPPGSAPAVPDPTGGQRKVDGKIIAAGVMMCVEGIACVALGSMGLLASLFSVVIIGPLAGLVAGAFLLMGAVGALCLAAAISSFKGRRWGIIAMIVLNSIALASSAVASLTTFVRNDGGAATSGPAQGLPFMAYSAVALGLAIAGRRQQSTL